MGLRALTLVLATVLAAGAVVPAAATRSTQQNVALASCEQRSLGLDSTHANWSTLAFSGRALAQVFLAEDTLVSSVTIWRDAAYVEAGSWLHLFICRVDSTLKPLPATGVLFDGPSIHPSLSDSATAPLTYTIDPPFALPSRGHFAIAIKEEDPYCDRTFLLLADSTNGYADGRAWVIHPFIDCHGLGSNATGLQAAQNDLIFRIEFCLPTTPAIETTWGELKARYR